MITKIIYTPGRESHSVVFFIYDGTGIITEKTRQLNTREARKVVNRVHNSVARGYGRIWPTDSGWIYIAHPPHGDERRRQWDRSQTAMAIPRPGN